MRFLYKAKNNKSEIITGTVKAETQYEAEKVLIGHNLIALELIPERKQKFTVAIRGRVNTHDRAIFARQIATMISAGLPLPKAVTVVNAQARTDRIRKVYNDIYRDLEEGYSFSSALAKHPEMFDRVFVSVVNSGETTGKLDVVLDRLAVKLENDNNFVGKVKSILYYPAFILVALIAIAIYMLIVVVPQLKSVFDQEGFQLPFATVALLSISDFFVNHWLSVLLIAIVLISFGRFWLGSDSGSRVISYIQLKVPGVRSLAEGIYVSRFSRTMEMLVGSGVPLLDCLRTGASLMNNEFYEESILNITTRVEKGVPLSVELLKSNVFPQIVGQMVAVGEETGKLDKVLGKVADYYEEEVSNRVKTLSSLIEPVVLVIIGAGVAFLVFAILLPIYNLSQAQ